MRGSPIPGSWPWLPRTAPQCGPLVRGGSLRASRSRSVLPPAAPARIRFADPSSPPVPLPMIRRSDFDPSVPDPAGSVPRGPALSGRSALPTPHPAQPQPPVHPFLPPVSVVSPTSAHSLVPHPCSLLLPQLVCSVRPTREAPRWVTGPLQPCARTVGSGRCLPQRFSRKKCGSYRRWEVPGGGVLGNYCFHLGGELAWVLEGIYLNWRGLGDGVVGE